MKKGTMKKILTTVAVVAVAVVAVFGMAACSGAERINVSGSTSVAPIMEKLAQAYEAQNKNVKIIVNANGSSVGIADATNETADIGMISRALKASEKGLTPIKICDDGVAIIANTESSQGDVTSQQVYDLYATGTAIGDISFAISRESGSGTRDAFDELIKNSEGKALKELTAFHANVEESNNTGAVMTAVVASSGKIGYISMGSLNDTVRALRFNGVEATAANVKSGEYKLSRPFNLVVKEGKTLSAATQGFIDFILSEAGQKIITDNGCIAL